jgi:hypothetical protein
MTTKAEIAKRLARIETELRRRTRVPLENALAVDIDEAVALCAIAGADDDELRALHETMDDGEIDAVIAEEMT